MSDIGHQMSDIAYFQYSWVRYWTNIGQNWSLFNILDVPAFSPSVEEVSCVCISRDATDQLLARPEPLLRLPVAERYQIEPDHKTGIRAGEESRLKADLSTPAASSASSGSAPAKKTPSDRSRSVRRPDCKKLGSGIAYPPYVNAYGAIPNCLQPSTRRQSQVHSRPPRISA
jgi:hypothetical protein